VGQTTPLSALTGSPAKGTKKRSQLSLFWKQFKKNGLAMAGLVVFSILILTALCAPLLVDYDEDVIGQKMFFRLQPPSKEYPFGTDQYGRNVMARVIWGARTSLFVGVFTVGFALTLGGTIGAIAAYYGGRIDNILMRIMDIFLAIPPIILAVAIVGAIGPGINNILLAMSISRAPPFARIVRSSVISVRDQEFVEAARVCGSSSARIIIRHILPNSMGPIIVQSTLDLATTILSVAGLSFIGLGIMPPDPEWGSMLAEARPMMRSHTYLMISPGLAIMIAVLSLNLMGDGFRDALDPRLKN